MDNVPQVTAARAEKLIPALIKTVTKETGIRLRASDLEMPMGETESKGFMFVTLANSTDAQTFQRAMHGLAFDKKHTFTAVPFGEVERYEALADTYVEPPTEEWKPRVSIWESRVL